MVQTKRKTQFAFSNDFRNPIHLNDKLKMRNRKHVIFTSNIERNINCRNKYFIFGFSLTQNILIGRISVTDFALWVEIWFSPIEK